MNVIVKKHTYKNGPKASSVEEELFKKFQMNIEKALKRAEEIKLNDNSRLLKKSSPPPSSGGGQRKSPSNDELNPEPIDLSSSFDKLKLTTDSQTGGSFTRDELAVLRNGSNINGRNYVPFFPEIDAKERFFFTVPYMYYRIEGNK